MQEFVKIRICTHKGHNANFTRNKYRDVQNNKENSYT